MNFVQINYTHTLLAHPIIHHPRTVYNLAYNVASPMMHVSSEYGSPLTSAAHCRRFAPKRPSHRRASIDPLDVEDVGVALRPPLPAIPAPLLLGGMPKTQGRRAGSDSRDRLAGSQECPTRRGNGHRTVGTSRGRATCFKTPALGLQMY